MSNLIKLAISFSKIGLFNFGGGMAMIPLILAELERHEWMSSDKFFDFFALAQMTPGAIAMNTATYVGTSVSGPIGGIVATSFLAAPSVIVMILLSSLLRKMGQNTIKDAIMKGMKPVTMALIIYAGWEIASKTLFIDASTKINWLALGLSVICLLIQIKVKRIHPILLLIAAGIVGIFIF